MATFTEVRTARKRHVRCENCRKVIEPGEKYERFSATPRDDMWNAERWTHLKAHAPYGSCVQWFQWPAEETRDPSRPS